jgi:Tol biopolymer transport system component
MALSVGARLGPYEIVAPLGAGGMGEVYRARDTKLGRDVALKILPDAFAQDRERLARFQREAQVLASLNHQNIAAIYGLEDSGSTHALVMELVEGPTLAERIDAGPIPLAEALPIATQIAEALETAHELGIVHRDLKPANIKLRPDGTVKVLDFGLAKMVEIGAGGPGGAGGAGGEMPANSPTISLAATQAGMILGTASYMAPEQARGRVVDKRADVWAFGVVLFEMLTGTRAFPGDDVSDTLATVLKFDPDWNRLPADTPAPICRLLKRCLTKDPKLRLRECGSALLDIHEAMTGPDASEAAARSKSSIDQRRQRRWLPVIVTALVAAIAGAAAWSRLATPVAPEPPSTRRFTITLPEGDVLPRASGPLLELSPEGRTLVYRARRGTATHLFRRAIDQFEATIIPGTDDAGIPIFSSDGLWIAFQERSGTDTVLKKIPIAGGPAQTIATLRGATVMRGAWTAEGRIMFGSGGSLMSVSAAGGDAIGLFKADGNLVVTNPHLLPGNSVLLTLALAELRSEGEIAVVKLGTGEKKTVQANATVGRLLPSGHLVFVRGPALWAVPFDVDRLEAVGTAVPVVEGVRVEVGGAVQLAVADDGTLAYVPGTMQGPERPLAFVGRDGGQPEALKIPARDYINLALSPDQTQVAAQIDDGDDADVWVAEIARGTLTRVTRDAGFDGFPIWSRDGESIVFASHREGRWTLQRRSADGTGDTALMTAFDSSVTRAGPYAWSSDGSTLLFGADEVIGATTASSKGEWKPVIRSAGGAAAVSPNGRWIAYTSSDSGAPEVYLQRFPAGQRHIVSVGGGRNPRWARDTGELFYLRGGPPNAVMRVAIRSSRDGGVDIGTPEVFAEFRFFSRQGGGTAYDVTPDGKRLLVITRGDEGTASDVQRINVVVNWFEELKRLVPVGK